MKNVAFLFPGQGSQYVGMGKDLFNNYQTARKIFEEANDALGFDLGRLCFEGSMEELTKTENTQPAILTVSVAAFRTYMEKIGVAPKYTAGHSLGEISALCCSGAISFFDAVRVVRQRGRFMQEAVAVGIGSMAAVSGVDKKLIEDVCSQITDSKRTVVVSNYNSPEQIVISGHSGAVTAAGEKLKELGARIIPLKVSAPFHSPLMQPAADRLREELMKYDFSDLKWPVISNINGLPYAGKDVIVQNLTEQVVNAVRWHDSMNNLQSFGVEIAVEIGPQAVLKNLMRKNAPNIKVYSFENDENISFLEKELLYAENKGSGDMEKGMQIITMCIAAAVSTKNTNWNNDEYQKGVVEPYKKIQKMKEELVKEGRQPSIEQVRSALEMLKSVLITKGVSMDERKEWFNDILLKTGTEQLFEEFIEKT